MSVSAAELWQRTASEAGNGDSGAPSGIRQVLSV
jgi:hypothetical protein